MKLKKLNKKDMGRIIKLHKNSIIPLWEELKRDYSIKEIKDYVNKTLNKGEIFGYFEKNKLVGCIGIIINKKKSFGEVRHVLVDEKFQMKGIGGELISYIEDYTKNKVDKLKLNVLYKNNAVKFYEKMGYKKYSYVMEKELKFMEKELK